MARKTCLVPTFHICYMCKLQPLHNHNNPKMGRKIRCKTCEDCLREPCGTCEYCLDSPRFGGPNIKKQACLLKRCKNKVDKDALERKMERRENKKEKRRQRKDEMKRKMETMSKQNKMYKIWEAAQGNVKKTTFQKDSGQLTSIRNSTCIETQIKTTNSLSIKTINDIGIPKIKDVKAQDLLMSTLDIETTFYHIFSDISLSEKIHFAEKLFEASGEKTEDEMMTQIFRRKKKRKFGEKNTHFLLTEEKVLDILSNSKE